MFLDIPDIVMFFGRFHPLVVHLPIGILLLAVVIALLSRKRRYKALAPALNFVLLLGAISAAIACVLGYMLSWGGDYNPDSLFWHQWAGILLAVLSFSIYWLRTRGWNKGPKIFIEKSYLAFWALLALIAFTGHLGGNLTHGSTYLLQYAPDPLRVMAGLDPKPVPRPQVTVLDSADIFLDMVHPLIESKCQSCHNQDKMKGELLLTNYEEMLKGGENGPSLVPGDLENSLLYQRVILPETHDDYMPAEGKPGLDDDQLALIKWWIENEAPPTMLLAEMELESDMTGKFQRVLGIGTSESRLPDMEAVAADSADLQLAREQGFIIKQIVPNSNFLEVRLPFTGQTLRDMDIKVLLGIKDQITWIDLSQGQLEDEDLATIGQLKLLSRVDLANNPISDEGIAHLRDLEEVRYLNLYGTNITDQGLATLKSLKKLQSLYLWQTKVSDSGVESLKKERPTISVTLGNLEFQKLKEPETSEIES
ncbi:MAG: c-type cytochrome domain-containing protein [Anditalea sp.]